SPAPVMMTALTSGSPLQPLSTAVISARIGVSQALSFHGLLSVTVPMPPVTSVMMTALLMGILLAPLEPAYSRAGFAAVKCRIERRRMFGKHTPRRLEQAGKAMMNGRVIRAVVPGGPP